MNLNLDWQVIAPVIVALIASLPGLLTFVRQRRRERAEVTEVITDASVRLIEQMQRRIESMSKRMEHVEGQLEKARIELNSANARLDMVDQEKKDIEREWKNCKVGVESLVAQVKQLGGEPIYGG
jgi:chromosome segregation ATPase